MIRKKGHLYVSIGPVYVNFIYHSGFLGKINTEENLLQQFQFIRIQVNTNLLKKEIER